MTQPAPQVQPTTTVTTTTKRVGIGDFTQRMIGNVSSPTSSLAVPADGKVPMLKAVGSLFGDFLTEGGAGTLFGAAHAKGWLDAGGAAWDGLVGLFSGAVAVVSAPYLPTVSRYAMRLARAGVTTFGFRKGFELASGGKPMLAGERVQVKPGEDHISAVAEKLDLI